MLIGTLTDGRKVVISKESPNEHIALWGISGSGKSTRIASIAANAVKEEVTVIAFDLNGSEKWDVDCPVNRISACEDGINIHLLDTDRIKNGKKSLVGLVSYLTDVFAAIYKLGVRQQGAMREAIQFLLEHGGEYPNEMEAIAEGLQGQDSDISKGVYTKLWQLLNCGVFRKSEKKLQKGCLNIVSFENLNSGLQKELAEIILAVIWHKLRTQKVIAEKICIIVDEFQNFMLRKNSVLLEMLRESRKYGVKIVLSTQSFSGVSKDASASVAQTAIQLFFRMSEQDLKKAAEIIAPQSSMQWMLVLKKLKVGQAATVGNISIAEKNMTKPIITQTFFDKKQHFCLK